MARRPSRYLSRSASRSGRRPSSAATVPAPDDVLRGDFTAARARHRCINRARLLAAINGERDFVSVSGLPASGRVRVVHLDGDPAADVGAGAAEVRDQENDTPNLPAGINRSVKSVRPFVSDMAL